MLLCCLFICSAGPNAYGQAEWISRIDRDRNGSIEPDEISDRAREYLERFARPYGISLSRPNSVERLEEAARRYYARQNRDDRDRDNESASGPSIKGFGPGEDLALIPGFGLANVRYPYTTTDVDSAKRAMERYDRDENGYIDAREFSGVRWSESAPNDFDFNKDGRLSVIEVTQRYAKRRISEQREQLAQQLSPPPNREADRDDDDDDRRNRWDRWRNRGRAGQSRDGDRGSSSLATTLIERYDFNKNDLLDANEMVSVGIPIAQVDYDRDGRVNRDELTQFLFSKLEQEASDMRELVPTWFFERDIDGDDQVTMAEFTDEWSQDKLVEFEQFDINRDGIITVNEVLSSNVVVGGQFANLSGQVLLPRSTIVSEIDVSDDYLIGDLNVQLSITHTFVSQLDGYLISPDGTRIELFTSVGGSDDHFDKTIFDDEAGTNITRGRPPFSGNFQPEALARRQPSLASFKGKNLKGVWQLMIRGSRSERSGILHGWSLNVQPDREAAETLATD
ncbi:proprotein convertase P-domain-containing protein [Planctomycetaceae bacterium SH139]